MVSYHSVNYHANPNLAHLIDKLNQVSYNGGWSENLQESSSPGTGVEIPGLQVPMRSIDVLCLYSIMNPLKSQAILTDQDVWLSANTINSGPFIFQGKKNRSTLKSLFVVKLTLLSLSHNY
jgi:hypothetical protein